MKINKHIKALKKEISQLKASNEEGFTRESKNFIIKSMESDLKFLEEAKENKLEAMRIWHDDIEMIIMQRTLSPQTLAYLERIRSKLFRTILSNIPTAKQEKDLDERRCRFSDLNDKAIKSVSRAFAKVFSNGKGLNKEATPTLHATWINFPPGCNPFK
ncbi:MAG: hypothetical protein QHC79_09705 [Pseudosphingobacterium sp.]|nr:hypothetical protein [Pseudosphingobacterium sp.]